MACPGSARIDCFPQRQDPDQVKWQMTAAQDAGGIHTPPAFLHRSIQRAEDTQIYVKVGAIHAPFMPLPD